MPQLTWNISKGCVTGRELLTDQYSAQMTQANLGSSTLTLYHPMATGGQWSPTGFAVASKVSHGGSDSYQCHHLSSVGQPAEFEG